MLTLGAFVRQLATALLPLALLAIGAERAVAQGGAPGESGEPPEYDMRVAIDPDEHRLRVSGTMLLPVAAQPTASYRVALSRSMRNFRIEWLGGRGVTRLEREGDHSNVTVWIVRPPRPIRAGERPRFRFSNEGGEEGGPVFYLGPDGSFADGLNTLWYPQVLVPRLNNPQSVGIVRYSFPSRYTLVATGLRQRRSRTGSQIVQRHLVTQPGYFSFAAGRYSVVRRPGRIPVSLYLLRPRPHAEAYLRALSSTLTVLEREFGRYPLDGFAVVEVPSDRASRSGFTGASQAGFILASAPYLEGPFNAAFFGHELGHQWFGNLVASLGALLGEGMAQYGSLQVVEALEGRAAAERYRRTGYPAYSPFQNGLGYLLLAHAGATAPLTESGPTAHLLANSKGFLAIDLLARTIGRERFREIVRTFVRSHRARTVAWADFALELRTSAGADLGWFFDQWFDRGGAPEFTLRWRQQDGILSGSIEQAEPAYRATIELEAVSASCARRRWSMQVAGSRTPFSVPIDGRIVEVGLDPDFRVLRWTPEYRAQAEALAPFVRGELLRRRGELASAERAYRAALQDVPARDLHGLRFLLQYGLGRVYAMQNRGADALAQLRAALSAPVRRSAWLPLVHLEIVDVAVRMGDGATAAQARAAFITATAAAHAEMPAPARCPR